MIDIAIATKNRKELFKKALRNLENQEKSENFNIYILDGNDTKEIREFLNKKKWKFKSIKYYFEKEIPSLKDAKGSWPKMYNFLLNKGKSKYLTYWSDDILLRNKNGIKKAIERIERAPKNVATSIFPFNSLTHSRYPYLMITEIGTVLLNFGIMKREAFKKIGGIDEKYRFFYADNEISNQLFKRGYKSIINLDIEVGHERIDNEWRNELSEGKNTIGDKKRAFKRWKKYLIKDDTIRENSIYKVYLNNDKFLNESYNKKLSELYCQTYDKKIVFYKNKRNMIKKFPKKLPGSFWGITTFFNPAGYKNKYENYKIFRKHSKKQGLKLCAVEVAFGNHPFELKKEDAEILIQIRGNEKNIMWQKERMMNIGLENLPKDCDKVAWLDCDIVFENDNWIEETSKLLEEYVIIQPFSLCIWLPEGNKIGIEEEIPWGVETGKKVRSRGCVRACKKMSDCRGYGESGHVGFAWAARRETFDNVGFYDHSIVGNSDQIMCDAFFKEVDKEHFRHLPEKLAKHQDKWKKKIEKRISASAFYTKGTLIHLWHGELKNRQYNERYRIINEHKFDPEEDIKIDKNGLFSWSTNKKKMHEEMNHLLISRKEDYTTKEKKETKIMKMEHKIDRWIGKVGIFLKKKSPKTYTRLKKYFPDKK